jgi:hypothetical protein
MDDLWKLSNRFWHKPPNRKRTIENQIEEAGMQTQTEGWSVTLTHVEQIRIVGPVNDRNHCLAWLDENRFDVKRSGPSDEDQSHPDWIKNFLVIAEKKQDEKMDSQSKSSTILGIQLKGLNINFARLLLTFSLVMLIWLIGLTVHLWSLERRLDVLQTKEGRPEALLRN